MLTDPIRGRVLLIGNGVVIHHDDTRTPVITSKYRLDSVVYNQQHRRIKLVPKVPGGQPVEIRQYHRDTGVVVTINGQEVVDDGVDFAQVVASVVTVFNH